MKTCSNCGSSVEPAAKICPHCGAALLTVWPPPPEGFGPLALPLPPRLLTKFVWTDFLLGVAGQYLTHLATARVLIRFVPRTTTSQDWVAQASAPGGFVLCELFWATVFGLIIYYALRRFYPVMARGSGYMTIGLIVVLLGAFFTCRPLLY